MEPAPKLWIYRNFFLIRCSRDLTWKIGTSKFYLMKISNWGHPYSWANKEKSEVKKKRKEKKKKGKELRFQLIVIPAMSLGPIHEIRDRAWRNADHRISQATRICPGKMTGPNCRWLALANLWGPLEGKWRGVNITSCLSSCIHFGPVYPSVGGITPDRWKHIHWSMDPWMHLQYLSFSFPGSWVYRGFICICILFYLYF